MTNLGVGEDGAQAVGDREGVAARGTWGAHQRAVGRRKRVGGGWSQRTVDGGWRSARGVWEKDSLWKGSEVEEAMAFASRVGDFSHTDGVLPRKKSSEMESVDVGSESKVEDLVTSLTLKSTL